MRLSTLIKSHWDEAAVYAFTVVGVFLGDYILNKTKPEWGCLQLGAALFVAAVLCLVVDLMAGIPDTEVKKAAKKKNFQKRMLFSGVAGIASGAVMPVVVKSVMASIGIQI